MLPKEYHDELSPAPPYFPLIDGLMNDLESQLDPDITMALLGSNIDCPFQTEPDRFGIFYEYTHGQLSITPDQFHSLSDIFNSLYLALDPFSNSHQPHHINSGSDL
jgi:hypothetical protein